MAKKTTNNKVDEFLRFRVECLRRTDLYRKDYDVWYKTLQTAKDCSSPDETMNAEQLKECYAKSAKQKKAIKKFEELEARMLQRYGLHYMPNPNWDNSWKHLIASTRAAVSSCVFGGKLNQAGILTGNTHETYTIDISRTDDEIVSDLFKLIKEERKKDNVKALSSLSLNANKYFDRFFAVYDAVVHGHKKWTYKMIVLKLQEKGFYSGMSEKKAVDLARQDFINAKKALGTFGKVFKRKKKDAMKPIFKLKSGKATKADMKEWEEMLDKEGLGLNEVLYKNGNIKYYGDNKDGVIRKRLIEEMN